MDIVNSLNKKNERKFKRTEGNEIIIVPTKKLLNWFKFQRDN